MKRLQKAALITNLISKLKEKGSWSGETHVQKAMFFLQELDGVPTEYEFILYRYGPYSSQLSEELARMRADGLVDVEAMPYPYGPALSLTDSAASLEKRFPKTIASHTEAILHTVDIIGAKDASELERLSTAFFFWHEKGLRDTKEIAESVNRVKPHVSVRSAEKAAEEIEKLASS